MGLRTVTTLVAAEDCKVGTGQLSREPRKLFVAPPLPGAGLATSAQVSQGGR